MNNSMEIPVNEGLGKYPPKDRVKKVTQKKSVVEKIIDTIPESVQFGWMAGVSILLAIAALSGWAGYISKDASIQDALTSIEVSKKVIMLSERKISEAEMNINRQKQFLETKNIIVK